MSFVFQSVYVSLFTKIIYKQFRLLAYSGWNIVYILQYMQVHFKVSVSKNTFFIKFWDISGCVLVISENSVILWFKLYFVGSYLCIHALLHNLNVSKSLQMHIQQQHTKTAPKFRCEICKTLLGRKSDLNVHMRKQHAFQETPMQCRYCDELFHDRYSLMQHQRTHRTSARTDVNSSMVLI